jgi:hypothetical protein
MSWIRNTGSAADGNYLLGVLDLLELLLGQEFPLTLELLLQLLPLLLHFLLPHLLQLLSGKRVCLLLRIEHFDADPEHRLRSFIVILIAS